MFFLSPSLTFTYAALVALDLLHVTIAALIFWPLWGTLPPWRDVGRSGVALSLLPVQVLCGGLCPIVWLQQCLVQGKADWFTQPFVYKRILMVSPWEVSEGVISVMVLVGEAVLVMLYVASRDS